jgi:hypothetical protein
MEILSRGNGEDNGEVNGAMLEGSLDRDAVDKVKTLEC